MSRGEKATDLSTLAGRIRAARKAAGLDQKALALRIGEAHQGTISDWETQKTQKIDSVYLHAVARETGVTVEWLRTGEGASPRPPGVRSAAAVVAEPAGPPYASSGRQGGEAGMRQPSGRAVDDRLTPAGYPGVVVDRVRLEALSLAELETYLQAYLDAGIVDAARAVWEVIKQRRRGGST